MKVTAYAKVHSKKFVEDGETYTKVSMEVKDDADVPVCEVSGALRGSIAKLLGVPLETVETNSKRALKRRKRPKMIKKSTKISLHSALLLLTLLLVVLLSETSLANVVYVPANFGTMMTFQREFRKDNATHGWKKGTLQGKLRLDALAQGRQERRDIFGLTDCAVIDDRLQIATTPKIGGELSVQVGDYVNVALIDGIVWECIIADMKNTEDPGCNSWGHDGGKSTVEIMYWTNRGNSGNQYNKVTSIEKVGNFWEVEND